MTTTTATSSTSTAATAATTSTSSATLGSSILTSLDAGSGVDTSSLITQLVAAERTSLEGQITAKQSTNTAQISAAATLSSDISTFSTSLDTLIAGGTLMSGATSSLTSVATATATGGARLGNLNSTVVVNTLATALTVQSAAFSGAVTSSASTLTISVNGTASPSIIIPANATASDVASAINAAKIGVTASVITSNGSSVLVLKGATGAKSGFTVASGVAALNYPATTTTTPATYDDNGTVVTPASTTTIGMTDNGTKAADASLTVDGVAVTSATNTLTNVISGLTLNLTGTGTTTLTGTRPTDAITSAVSDFVDAYNVLKQELDSYTAAATSTTDAGVLRGNTTIRDMQRQLQQLTTTRLTGSGTVTTLAQLGVKTAQDGTLSVDSTTLSNALATYPDDVEAMFNPSQSSSSSAVSILSKVGAVAAGSYALTDLAAGPPASGKVNGVAATGSGSTLTVASGTAAGLIFSLSGTQAVPSTATLTVDLGIGGALALIKNMLTGTSGTLTTLQSQLTTTQTSLADKLADAEDKVTTYQTRLTAQFSAMNTRVSAYKSTQSYLTEQIAQWDKSNNS